VIGYATNSTTSRISVDGTVVSGLNAGTANWPNTLIVGPEAWTPTLLGKYFAGHIAEIDLYSGAATTPTASGRRSALRYLCSDVRSQLVIRGKRGRSFRLAPTAYLGMTNCSNKPGGTGISAVEAATQVFALPSHSATALGDTREALGKAQFPLLLNRQRAVTRGRKLHR